MSASASTRTAAQCSLCDDAGFVEVSAGRVARCKHPQPKPPLGYTCNPPAWPSPILTLEFSTEHRLPITQLELQHLVAGWIKDGAGPNGQTLSADELQLLRLLEFHCGQRNAITIGDIASKLEVDRRVVTRALETLRGVHDVRIGSSKGHRTERGQIREATEQECPAGVFLCLTPREWGLMLARYLRESLGLVDFVRRNGGSKRNLDAIHAALEGAHQVILDFSPPGDPEPSRGANQEAKQ